MWHLKVPTNQFIGMEKLEGKRHPMEPTIIFY